MRPVLKVIGGGLLIECLEVHPCEHRWGFGDGGFCKCPGGRQLALDGGGRSVPSTADSAEEADVDDNR